MTDSATRPFQLAVCQSAPLAGESAVNAERIAEAVKAARADLLVLPELALTGYDVRDRVHELSTPAAQLNRILPLPPEYPALVGFIERDEAGIPYNAAALMRDGAVAFVHRKLYLPTYGMFDEGRYFGRGRQLHVCLHRGLRLGVLICEDFWHPALIYLLACQNLDLLVVQAAAPGRGIAPETPGSIFASTAIWERLVVTTAQLYGVYVALCNRVGSENGVTFAGGSLIAGPTGQVLEAAPALDEALLQVAIDPAELARARRPYAHVRDEDPHLVLRELHRILGTHA